MNLQVRSTQSRLSIRRRRLARNESTQRCRRTGMGARVQSTRCFCPEHLDGLSCTWCRPTDRRSYAPLQYGAPWGVHLRAMGARRLRHRILFNAGSCDGVILKNFVRLKARKTPVAKARTPMMQNTKNRLLTIWLRPSLSRRARYSDANFTCATPYPRSSIEKYAVTEATSTHSP